MGMPGAFLRIDAEMEWQSFPRPPEEAKSLRHIASLEFHRPKCCGVFRPGAVVWWLAVCNGLSIEDEFFSKSTGNPA